MKTVNKYNGMTRRQYKRVKGSSTPGKLKGENCQASGLDKSMAKNPRSFKTMPVQYFAFNQKKADASHDEKSWFKK